MTYAASNAPSTADASNALGSIGARNDRTEAGNAIGPSSACPEQTLILGIKLLQLVLLDMLTGLLLVLRLLFWTSFCLFK